MKKVTLMKKKTLEKNQDKQTPNSSGSNGRQASVTEQHLKLMGWRRENKNIFL